MATIASFNRKLQTVDFKRIAVESVEQTKDNIPPLNQNMLSTGFLINGSPIRPYYADIKYAAKKITNGSQSPFGTPDLKLTGAFYQGIGVVVNSQQYAFTIDSTDSKAAKLEATYTNQIYGLNKENNSTYALVYLKPTLFANLKAALGI